MDNDVRTRNDFEPALPPPPASLPPEDKVTLQRILSVILGFIVLTSLVGAIFGVVEKATLSHILVGAMSGVLALLTGGNRVAR